MSDIATVLHVSDFHFDSNLTERGRRHWRRNFGVKSHAFGKVDALSAKATALKGLGLGGDLLLATGDISTDGSAESLEVAKEFIECEEIYRGNPARLVTVGLGMKETDRIVIPGNHDRYAKTALLPYQHPSPQLEEVFGLSAKYPYSVGYRRQGIADDPTEPALLFFVFDSTASGQLAESPTPWVRIARGRIEDAECRWLVSEAQRIQESGEVKSLDEEVLSLEYDNSIRIAVLHHHPINRSSREPFDGWSEMENNEAFVNACFEAQVDVVLFGHEHRDYWTHEVRDGGTQGVYFFCCPSTSEFTENDNGFFYIDFNVKHFVVRACTWNGRSFIENEPRKYLYDRQIGIASGARGR